MKLPGATKQIHAAATDHTGLSPTFGRRLSQRLQTLPCHRVRVESMQVIEVHPLQAVESSEYVDVVFVNNWNKPLEM